MPLQKHVLIADCETLVADRALAGNIPKWFLKVASPWLPDRIRKNKNREQEG